MGRTGKTKEVEMSTGHQQELQAYVTRKLTGKRGGTWRCVNPHDVASAWLFTNEIQTVALRSKDGSLRTIYFEDVK